jgi:hypothetical protein
MKTKTEGFASTSQTVSRMAGPRAAAIENQRPTAAAQQQLASVTAHSPQAAAQRQLADLVTQSPRMAAQRKAVEGMFGGAVQRKAPEEEMRQGRFGAVQRKGPEDEEPLQGKFGPAGAVAQREEEPARSPNRTGLPDHLKAGVENLSGMAMDDVRVHYGSDKPAQLNALAYTQGTDIHVAPGQEQHLAHEAWHVVQQKQGRVRPTLQMKEGVPVNDDAGLEKEADVMGERSLASGPRSVSFPRISGPATFGTCQLLSDEQREKFLEYANEKFEEKFNWLDTKWVTAKVNEIADQYPGQKPKDLTNAKGAFDKALVAKFAEREKTLPGPVEEEKKSAPPVQDSKSQQPAQPPQMPVNSTKKQDKAQPMSLGDFQSMVKTTAPKMGYGEAAKTGKQVVEVTTSPATTKVSDGVNWLIGKIESWKPSQGHDGVSGIGRGLTIEDLNQFVEWVKTKNKYFITKGEGTGDYSAKNQLKIIHKTLFDGVSGKNVTYHITLPEKLLDKLDVSD